MAFRYFKSPYPIGKWGTCDPPPIIIKVKKSQMKVCIKCGINKPLKEFRLQPSKKCRRNDCIACERKRHKETDIIRKTAPPKPEVCDLCNQPGELVLDHDHETMEFRGWIHHACNRGLAFLGDNVIGVEKAYHYLMEKRDTNKSNKGIK